MQRYRDRQASGGRGAGARCVKTGPASRILQKEALNVCKYG